MASLKDMFEAEIRNLITTTLRETDYRPSMFMRMVGERGAYDACLSLVRAPKPSDGFTKLWDIQRLDLTVEAVVQKKEYTELFLDEDIAKAIFRLREYGFNAGAPSC